MGLECDTARWRSLARCAGAQGPLWRRRNVRHLILFASDDDPFIPLRLQRSVRDGLASAGAGGAAGGEPVGTFEYIELEGRSHFFAPRQPEILAAVERVAAGSSAK